MWCILRSECRINKHAVFSTCCCYRITNRASSVYKQLLGESQPSDSKEFLLASAWLHFFFFLFKEELPVCYAANCRRWEGNCCLGKAFHFLPHRSTNGTEKEDVFDLSLLKKETVPWGLFSWFKTVLDRCFVYFLSWTCAVSLEIQIDWRSLPLTCSLCWVFSHKRLFRRFPFDFRPVLWRVTTICSWKKQVLSDFCLPSSFEGCHLAFVSASDLLPVMLSFTCPFSWKTCCYMFQTAQGIELYSWTVAASSQYRGTLGFFFCPVVCLHTN